MGYEGEDREEGWLEAGVEGWGVDEGNEGWHFLFLLLSSWWVRGVVRF